ncbi:FAD-dependent oxidoreductase [Pseudomonas sp. SDO524_S393]
MHIIVVGAGISGTVTALSLINAGHSVEVIEGAQAPATGASLANAGLISPGHCFSWAEPGVVGVAIKSLLGLGDGIGIYGPWTAALARWATLFAREATESRWLANSKAALALASYSRDLQFKRDEISQTSYGGRHNGILYLYGEGQAPGPHDALLLQEAGEHFEELDAAALLKREPLLNKSEVAFAKGVYCAHDGTGDAARYASAALDKAVELGATVQFDTRVLGFDVRDRSAKGVFTNKGHCKADLVVVTAGLASRSLLKSIQHDLPIHPVTGYSVSYDAPLTQGPTVGAVSIPHKVAWANFGAATRFTGFADVGVPGRRTVERRFKELERFAGEVCPQLKTCTPRRWVGQRPMTPDNLPFLGASRVPNILLNCGHGAMGWTMACGSARIITDLVMGNEPAIDLTPYHWRRYGVLGRTDQHLQVSSSLF